MGSRALGIRARIAILVALAAVPALGFTLFNALEERRRLELDARKDLLTVARFEALRQEQLIEGARQALIGQSQGYLAFLRRGDQRGCNAYAGLLVGLAHGMYHSAGVQRANGELFCNSEARSGTVNVRDRRYFRLVLETGQFAIGDYQIGRVTHRQGVNLGYPLRASPDGPVEAVAFLALDLEEFERRASGLELAAGTLLVITDYDGVVLAGNAAGTRVIPAGRKLSLPVLRTVLDQRTGSVLQDEWRGETWLGAHEAVSGNPDGSLPLHVFVALPHAAVVSGADRRLVRNIAGLSIAALCVLALGWWGADLSIMPRMRRLLDAAKRVRSGELAARTGLKDDGNELGRLGVEFDRMAETLERRDIELKAALHALREQSITDPLTGLYNRRHLEELLARDLQRAERSGQPLSLVMVDADHFKRINDTHGHDAGDEVLWRMAALLKGAVRGGDVACRFGGEEFLLLLPGASGEAARARAESIRTAMARLEITIAGRPIGPITASMGIASYPANGKDARALLKAADEALYQAKGGGRDRVVLASG